MDKEFVDWFMVNFGEEFDIDAEYQRQRLILM